MTKEFTEESDAKRFVRLAILQGITEGASDILFEADGNGLLVRYRVDGVFHNATEAPKAMSDEIISVIKLLSSMDISVRKSPQDGRMSITHDGEPVDLRVAVLPTVNGASAIMRVINSNQGNLSLEELGFSASNLERFRSAINKPHGMVLVTGPADSGKTTTLYAALKEIANPGVKSVAIENYTEHEIPNVQQSQLNVKAGWTYSEAIKQFMRVTPHNIIIDELRDVETISTAMQASLTGHLVLSTLHVSSASEVPVRLIDLGLSPRTVSAALSAVVSQRILRRLCATCKESYSPSAEELLATGFSINGKKWEEGDDIPTLHKPSATGCEKCHGTGFKGRIAVHEVLLVNDAIRSLISKDAESSLIEKEATENGMTTMIDDGWEKVLSGIVTLEDVSRYIG